MYARTNTHLSHWQRHTHSKKRKPIDKLINAHKAKYHKQAFIEQLLFNSLPALSLIEVVESCHDVNAFSLSSTQ